MEHNLLWIQYLGNLCWDVPPKHVHKFTDMPCVFKLLLYFSGEGFHNYHHTFPFDYSASELGLTFNPTTWFIDFMFWLGWVTDRKQAPKEMIQARKERTGDGSAWEVTLWCTSTAIHVGRAGQGAQSCACGGFIFLLGKVIFFRLIGPN